VREIVEEAEEIGWTFVRFSAHGNVVLRHPTGGQVSISQTPKAPYIAFRNARAELRKVLKHGSDAAVS
jgi:hypothetical protein